MGKNRSTYTFQFNCAPNLINDLVQSYIQSNQYELQNKNGEQYYRAGDAMIQGYKYFNYSINGQTITIYAWLKGAFGEFSLEQNSLNMMAMNYRNSLNTLFQEINKLNNPNFNNNLNFNNINQPINQNGVNQSLSMSGSNQQFNQNNGQPVQNDISQFTQSFQNEMTKKQEKTCEIGFWFSLFGVLGAFAGVSYGIIVYVMDFYFASQGMKTSKRKKAIATIILSILSILIVVFQIAAA